MGDGFTFLAYCLVLALLVFAAVIISTVFGAFSGLVVGWFFEDTIKAVFLRFGVDMSGVAMWQIGATLGFIGSFFTAVQTNKAGK